MYRSIFSLLNKKRKRHMLLLLPAMILASLLEMVGIGMIVSVCALLVREDLLYENRIVLWVCELLHIQPGRALIRWILAALMVLYTFRMVYLTLESYLVARFVRTTRSEMSVMLFQRVVRAPYSFFVEHGTAEIQNLLGGDVDLFGSGLSACMRSFLEGIIAVGMGLFLLLLDPTMTLFVTAGIIILLVLTRLVLNRFIERASERQRAARRTRWKWLHQAVAGIKDVRVGRHEDYFSDRFAETDQSFARMEYQKQFLTKLPTLCIETIIVLSVLAYLISLTSSGRDLSQFVPSLSALAMVAVRLLPSCNRINSSLTRIRYSMASVEAIHRTIQETEPETAAPDRVQKPVAFDQGISLRDVCFTYKDGAETVLEHVDVDIPAGASVGIVGPSGAGKTTLLDLLLGLLIPGQGQVLVDGVPIGECRESYLQKVAYVPQNTFLLDDTIRGNVAMGEDPEQADDERIWEALEQAALARMVRGLPEGLDTQVGERGVRLSGGERQRLGLARAIYRDPAVIVFDEATSALDLDTEAEVLGSIMQWKGKKTLVIVSHRQSAIDPCDRVYRVRDKEVHREK